MSEKECFFPWFVPDSVTELEDNLLKPNMIAFEWGSGKSTIWLARRVEYVVTVDHDKEWYDQVWRWVQEEELKNVNLAFIGLNEEYENFILKFEHDFNIILIDGRRRVNCITKAIDKLKPGGILVVDNSERKEYEPGLWLLDGWQRRDWESGNSENWTTSIFWKPDE